MCQATCQVPGEYQNTPTARVLRGLWYLCVSVSGAQRLILSTVDSSSESTRVYRTPTHSGGRDCGGRRPRGTLEVQSFIDTRGSQDVADRERRATHTWHLYRLYGRVQGDQRPAPDGVEAGARVGVSHERKGNGGEGSRLDRTASVPSQFRQWRERRESGPGQAARWGVATIVAVVALRRRGGPPERLRATVGGPGRGPPAWSGPSQRP